MKKTILNCILLTVALFAGLFTASATVTPYAWWHMGETNNAPNSYMYEATTNGFNFNNNFENSAVYVGDFAAWTNMGVGGPLGPNKIFSTTATFSHLAPNNNGGFISYANGVPTNQGPWQFATNRNWVMECWVLPIANGTRNNSSANGCILNMGGQNFTTTVTNWGCEFWCVSSNDATGAFQDGTVEIQCWCVGAYSAATEFHSGVPYYLNANSTPTPNQPWNFQLGTNYVIKTSGANGTNMWTHLAVVRDDLAGTVTFYINGHAMASTAAVNVYQPPLLTAPYVPYTQPDGPSISTDNASQPSIQGINTNFVPPAPAGQTGLGGSGNRQYNGFIDEVRFSSFAPGAFSVSDLLTRSVPGPGIVQQPANVTVYAGGAAPFQVIPAFDTTATFQWYQVVGSTLTAISGGAVTTNPQLILPAVTTGMTGNKYVCALSNASGTQYSTTNTLTVVANPTTHTAYAAAVTSHPSVISYWPGDGDSALGTTLTDVVSGHNGTLSGNAEFDGETNRFSAGQGLTFNRNGEWSFNVIDDVAVAPQAAYNFASGFGTVEAVLYLDPAATQMPIAFSFPQTVFGFAWLSEATLPIQANAAVPINNGINANYVFSADVYGHLFYWAPYYDQGNSLDSVPLEWSVPGGTVGRQMHVAFTFANNSNVTCYVNGQSLGTQQPFGTNVIFGGVSGLPLHIGNASLTQVLMNAPAGTDIGTTNLGEITEGFTPEIWFGSIDELAIYATNLPANTIAQHAFALNNGSASVAVTATNLTPSKSMFAKGSQTIKVAAGGTPPFTYQWYTNITSGGGPIVGATNPTVTVATILQTVSVSCVVTGAVGSVTSAPTVITISTPAVGSYADQVMSNAPVAFYRFNEASGTSVYDWAGSHDGTYSGAYAQNVAGPAAGEGGVQFFGTNATPVNLSQVDIPWAPELNTIASSNLGEFTYECWFKPTTTNVDQCPLSGRFRLGSNLAGVRVYFNDDLAQPEGNGQTGNNFGSGANANFEGQFGRYNNVNQAGRLYNTPTVIPPTNVWHHLVVCFSNSVPGASATLGSSVPGVFYWYVDGTLYDNSSQGFAPLGLNGGSDYQPNHFADIIMGNKEIGNNNPHANPCTGVIGDVAIYTYPLTAAQVANHYSAYFTAATNNGVTPASVSTNEGLGNTIVLTANITGGNGATYQWFLNGVALSASTQNTDGSLRYPSVSNGLFDTEGVDAPILVITEASPSDNGNYVLVIYDNLNAGGQLQTSPVNVSVTPDLTQPHATGAGGIGAVFENPSQSGPTAAPGVVEVYFNKEMDVTTATDAANYSISDGVVVSNVFLARTFGDTRFDGQLKEVALQTSPLTPGHNYTLSVTGVKDATYTGNLVVTPNTEYFTAPIAKSGMVWDFYPCQSNGFAGLTSGQYDGVSYAPFPGSGAFIQGTNSFPYVPQYEASLTNFDTRQLDDGGNYSGSDTSIGLNPIFGDGMTIGSGEASHYAAMISGWITPTNTDNYDFFMLNDDQGALYLSSDNTPGNLQMIVQATGVNTVFQEPSNPWIAGPSSDPGTISLTAGQSYYIEALLYQASGNDYLAVAWRGEGNGPNGINTPNYGVIASSLTPIPGTFLSSYGRAGQPVMTAKVNGGSLTISWTGDGRLFQSTTLSLPLNQWTPVAGNPSSPYVTATGATHMFYAIVQ